MTQDPYGSVTLWLSVSRTQRLIDSPYSSEHQTHLYQSYEWSGVLFSLCRM